MQPEPHSQPVPQACVTCLARSALIALLSARIEHAARDADRLIALLCLQDEALIDAIGGRKRDQLRRQRDHLLAEAAPPACCIAACEHDSLHQRLFDTPDHALPAPAVLYLSGASDRIDSALRRPIVALVGTAQASDYGMEMACFLARSLARSGLSVVSSFSAGVPAAVHLGVLEAGCTPLAVTSSGLDICRPAHLRKLWRRLHQTGVVLSEMPHGFRGRRWSDRAAERILIQIASLVVVVEPDQCGGMLAARLAQRDGKQVGALPGRVTSSQSRGAHRLLREGVPLIASPQDVLDLLYGVPSLPADQPLAALSAPSLRLLEQIGSGEDTIERLVDASTTGRLILELSELRAAGLLARGDDGRYMPRVSLAESHDQPS